MWEQVVLVLRVALELVAKETAEQALAKLVDKVMESVPLQATGPPGRQGGPNCRASGFGRPRCQGSAWKLSGPPGPLAAWHLLTCCSPGPGIASSHRGPLLGRPLVSPLSTGSPRYHRGLCFLPPGLAGPRFRVSGKKLSGPPSLLAVRRYRRYPDRRLTVVFARGTGFALSPRGPLSG